MNIAVVNSFMNDTHREKIRAAAAAHQMNVAFYTSIDEALPHMADVDIIYAAATNGGHKLAQAAPHLKWFCSVSAGSTPSCARESCRRAASCRILRGPMA